MSTNTKTKSGSTTKKDKDDSGNPDLVLAAVGNYTFQKTVGEGNFAKVKLAVHKLTGQEVAIKIIDKTTLDEKKLSKLYREVKVMKGLHHPNIVKLYEVIETKNTVFLVMEYASGGELYDYLVVHGKMKEKEARAKFRQILSAVSYCHKKRVIHRDLKAENLLLDANLDIKIADFGFSNFYDPDNKLDTFCGSPPYAAPELFQGRRYTGPEVDIWSLGVILYVLTTGCLPFDGKNLQEMRESVCRGKYRIPFYLSDNCEKLLRKFLVRDPQKRATLDIVADDGWINESHTTSPVVMDESERVEEDEAIIKSIVVKYKLDREQVLKSIRDTVYDDISALYYMTYYEKQTRTQSSAKDNKDSSTPSLMSPALASPESQLSSPLAEALPSPPTAKTPNMLKIEEDAVLTHAADVPGNPPTTTTPLSGPSAVAVDARKRRFTVGTGATATTSPVVLPPQAQSATTDKKISDPVADLKPTPPKPDSPSNTTEGEHGRRGRSTTIVGIFRNQRKQSDVTGVSSTGPGQPGTSVSAAATDSDASVATVKMGEEGKPRSLRFTFNSNTTSSKPPDDIVAEILRACAAHSMQAKAVSKYLLECTFTPREGEFVRWEVEVCKLPRLNNLHGLRFKRLSGSSTDYKECCERILASVAL